METDTERSAGEPAKAEVGVGETVDGTASTAAAGKAAGAEQAEITAARAPADTMPVSARGRHLG